MPWVRFAVRRFASSCLSVKLSPSAALPKTNGLIVVAIVVVFFRYKDSNNSVSNKVISNKIITKRFITNKVITKQVVTKNVEWKSLISGISIKKVWLVGRKAAKIHYLCRK